MKELKRIAYEKPVSELEEFRKTEVITTSGQGDDNDVEWPF